MSYSLVRKIDREVKRRSLLKHPFYQMWTRGELNLNHLSGYSREYFQLVRAIPGMVNNIETKSRKESERRTISKSVSDESDHIRLWLRFASSLGKSESELMRSKGSSKTREAVSELERLSGLSFEEAVAAMYAYECALPEISRTKKEGLKKFYGINSEDAMFYFDTHEKVDIKHAAVWRNILNHVSKENERKAMEASIASLEAQNKLLDSVMEKYVS